MHWNAAIANRWSNPVAPYYNVLASQDGRLWEGAGLTNSGPHSGTTVANTNGIACCCLQPSNAAGVPQAAVSQAMKNSVRGLYEWCCQQAGRRLEMRGHRDIVSTMCPGPDLYAWVRQGMPAQAGPTPAPEPPPTQRRQNLITSGRTVNRDGSAGNLHSFIARGSTCFFRFRGRDGKWNPANSWAVFAPGDKEIIGLSCGLDDEGTFHVFADYADRSQGVTWQKPGSTTWAGAAAGQAIARFQAFAKL
jgi:hypothetical protein